MAFLLNMNVKRSFLFLLRASAHHWHVSAFCVIWNSSEFPITQNDSKLCNLLTDIRCRFFTFRPVSSIYI